uniref:Protein kinase domain-containing protein n=1 Tax=Ananas comosus var. bracteatus TaxID=296719 RepID=A0A6V7PAQ6_ANACO|nr:unnamed protein product [Ananas comosus var. bracteatus]
MEFSRWRQFPPPVPSTPNKQTRTATSALPFKLKKKKKEKKEKADCHHLPPLPSPPSLDLTVPSPNRDGRTMNWMALFLLLLMFLPITAYGGQRGKVSVAGEKPRKQYIGEVEWDPCLSPPWEGFYCLPQNGTFVIFKLDLSSKSLQGPIPTAIGYLTDLIELNLDNNNFTGSIPESFELLRKLSNLSINCNPSLSDQLPTGLSTRMNFTLNSRNCYDQEQTPPQRNNYTTCSPPAKRGHPAIKNPVFSESIHDPTNPVVQQFPLQYIQNATENYKTLIGEGGFGVVYKGVLPHGQEVAVKVRSASSTQGTREFNNELRILSTIQQDNLVPLLGYCCENDQQILVYPFMSNGSLQDRLYGEAAKGKSLIGLQGCRLHWVLLKVLFDPAAISQSDVFSFGVVLLEIVTGREPLNIHRPRNEWSLVEWAKPFIRESRIEEIVDPTIKSQYHSESMWRVVEAALACTEPFATFRPSMSDIVRELEDALIIENNASEYMRSIESTGGSNRFLSVERKMLAPASTAGEPALNYCPIPR